MKSEGGMDKDEVIRYFERKLKIRTLHWLWIYCEICSTVMEL